MDKVHLKPTAYVNYGMFDQTLNSLPIVVVMVMMVR